MLSNPEEFQHLPTVDDEVVEKPVVPSTKPPGRGQPASVPALPTVDSSPAPAPFAKAPAAPPSVPKTSSPAALPSQVPERSPEVVRLRPMPAKPLPNVQAPAPAAPTTPAFPAIPPPPPLQPAPVKNTATKRVPLPVADSPAKPAKSPSAPAAPAVLKPPSRILVEGLVDEVSPPAGSWRERWEQWGGRSLALSVGIHLLLLIAAALIVVHQVMDRQIDFLPGGGSVQGEQAESALQHKIQQKKNPWLKQSMPIRKLAVNSMKSVVLPTDSLDMPDLPMASSKPLSGGALGGGFGLAGAAGGFGKGVGLGAQSGMTFGPLFGLNIKARKLAVVLDVSTSMTPHLERVVKEVDKVAKGSVVVLYFGCGLEPPVKALVGTKVFKTSAIEFEKFWRMQGATFMQTSTYKIDPKDPIPQKDLFLQLSRRPQTYFIHNVGVGYTWLALLSDEVRNADGLYWFSDFQDTVDFKQVSTVLDNLKRRKQRLYIHSYGKGQYFDLIKTQLVEPTHGDSYVEE